MKISLMWLSMLVLISVLAMAVNAVGKNLTSDREKWIQFECGFNGMTPSHVPFSFQFFLVAVLFLIFDIEIALVLSYPIESKMTLNSVLILLFVLILGVGLILEWQKGKIEWTS